jgi:opacity protein-like surface antigen
MIVGVVVMKKRVLGVAGLCYLVSFPLFAVLPSGFYVNAGSGGSYSNYEVMSNKGVAATVPEAYDYINPDVGLADIGDRNESAFGASYYQVALGYADAVYPFRLEFSYLKNNKKVDYEGASFFVNGANPKINDFDIQFKTDSVMMANVYMDMIPRRSVLLPYVVLGVGYAEQKVKWEGTSVLNYINTDPEPDVNLVNTQTFSGDKTAGSLAAQAGAGMRVWIINNFLVDLSIRYAYLGKLKWSMPVDHEITTPASFTLPVEYRTKFRRVTFAQLALSLTFFFGDQEKHPTLLTD